MGVLGSEQTAATPEKWRDGGAGTASAHETNEQNKEGAYEKDCCES